MKRGLVVAAVLAGALLATGCEDDGPTFLEELMAACYDEGGVYFEYESTSAGSHIWCVGPDGEQIAIGVSEGDAS